MTPASFSNTESVNDIITRNLITLPSGWAVAGELSADNGGDAITDMTQLKANLQIAGDEALELINDVQRQAEIQIPEAYLRVEKETIFHLLLLVNQTDFHSPKIMEAKLIAENYAKNESRFDLRISFGNIGENNHRNAIIDSGYKLIHIEPDDV